MWVIVCSILVFNCLLALLVVHFRKRRKSAADDLTKSLREVAGYEIPVACEAYRAFCERVCPKHHSVKGTRVGYENGSL